MTHAEFVTKVIGLKPDVLRYADPGIAAAIVGAASNGISAYRFTGMAMMGGHQGGISRGQNRRF